MTVRFQFSYSNLPVSITSTLGAVLNILLLIALIKDPLKCFRNSATYLVMNLSVSDCLTCIISVCHRVTKSDNNGVPFVFECLLMWFTSASIMSIFSVSVDRFLIVVYPIKHRIYTTGKIMILWLATIWVFTCVVALLKQFLAFRREAGAYILASFFITLSGVMYALTYYKLKKQSRNLASFNSIASRAQEIRIMKEKKFLNTIVIIASIAFFCIVPAMTFFQTSNSLHDTAPHVKLFTDKVFRLVFYLNFVVNPLIYASRLPNYRKTFYLVYLRKQQRL